MKIGKWRSLLCLFGIVAILSMMFFLVSIITVFVVMLSLLASSPYLLGDENYQFLLAMKKYDLECAILATLRSSRIINNGRDWLTLAQIIYEVNDRVGERNADTGCIMVLRSLVQKGVVGMEESASGTSYVLLDKTYIPKMPQKIDHFVKKKETFLNA